MIWRFADVLRLFYACLCVTILAGCTADAYRCCGVEFQSAPRDFFAALLAISVLSILHARQSRVEPDFFYVAPDLLCLGHGLILQRIHPAEAPDRLLVQRYHRLTLSTCLRTLFQVRETVMDFLPECFDI